VTRPRSWTSLPRSSSSTAFIYSGGTLQNLNNLIPAGSSYQLTDATAINDSGQIVANAYDTVTYQNHVLLLTPS